MKPYYELKPYYQKCGWCHKTFDTDDSPMLKNEVWMSICGKWDTRMMCLDCMVKKLGREITENDLKIWDDISNHIPLYHVPWNSKFVVKMLKSHKIPTWEEYCHFYPEFFPPEANQ